MEKTVKRIFQIAGIYGILVLSPQLFLGAEAFRDVTPPITHTAFLYGFTGLALVWQLVFFIIASDPKRYRLIMLGAILEKASFGIVCLSHYFFKEIIPDLFLGGMIDLAIMFAFIFCFIKTEKS